MLGHPRMKPPLPAVLSVRCADCRHTSSAHGRSGIIKMGGEPTKLGTEKSGGTRLSFIHGNRRCFDAMGYDYMEKFIMEMRRMVNGKQLESMIKGVVVYIIAPISHR